MDGSGKSGGFSRTVGGRIDHRSKDAGHTWLAVWIAHAGQGGSRRSRIPQGEDSPTVWGKCRRATKGERSAGPHDTLQPQDESIIVGYYTSAGSAPRPTGRTNEKGALWRETTGLTVPAQET